MLCNGWEKKRCRIDEWIVKNSEMVLKLCYKKAAALFTWEATLNLAIFEMNLAWHSLCARTDWHVQADPSAALQRSATYLWLSSDVSAASTRPSLGPTLSVLISWRPHEAFWRTFLSPETREGDGRQRRAASCLAPSTAPASVNLPTVTKHRFSSITCGRCESAALSGVRRIKG